jgi:hypothetical protein
MFLIDTKGQAQSQVDSNPKVSLDTMSQCVKILTKICRQDQVYETTPAELIQMATCSSIAVENTENPENLEHPENLENPGNPENTENKFIFIK